MGQSPRPLQSICSAGGYLLRKGAPWLFRKLGIYSCEPERHPGWLWAGNGCRKWGNPTDPGKCACGQELWTAGLIDKQVLTQMECGVSTFPWKHKTQVFIWSFYASNALAVAFQNPLSACSSTWFFPPHFLYLVSEHSQNSQTALELSTEQGRSAWLSWAGTRLDVAAARTWDPP